MDFDINEMMREAIKVAWRARKHKNHPFGAILVDKEGNILLEAENTVESDMDVTSHAERNLVSMATKKYNPEFLKDCVLVSSAEPCPMCSGAIYWSNIGTVIYGLSEQWLYEISDPLHLNSLLLSCRDILTSGTKVVNVIGPILEDEAREPHLNFWKVN
ncbi:MAG: nucleoside deaminase [Sphaerochaetaceae bacterium]|nr:nucleoside deaminase [Sphaerochaetaceae bacterium]MDC7236297.1 nucleoside deaminase [Sphaerochaetaceae bacterium]MDC7250259.1 nucleoside deaminase [Sphaerochaetaceae bacterium]